MPDYRNMTAVEALREAKDASGMTAEAIAAGVGISASHLRRYLDPNDNYAPSLHIIPALCRTMRNTVMLQWLEAQIAVDDTSVTPAATRADVLTAVARAGSALGEVQRIVAEAQVLYPSTARELRSGLGDVIAACRNAQAGLQPLAEQRDSRAALASLSCGELEPPVAMPEPMSGEVRRPWWKVWGGVQKIRMKILRMERAVSGQGKTNWDNLSPK